MISLIVSILAFGIIVLVHEFGHFITAKAFGVGVIEFSIGMGPRIFSKVCGNTRYSLKLLPFGGSCMMVDEELVTEGENKDAGKDIKKAARYAECFDEASEKREEGEAQGSEGEESKSGKSGICGEEKNDAGLMIDGRLYPASSRFINKAAWKRFLIIAAGPVFNFILAFLFAMIIVFNTGYQKSDIVEVEAGYPAAETGIEPGDTIVKIGNDTVRDYNDIRLYMLMHESDFAEGMPVTLTYTDSEGEENTVSFNPVYDEETGSHRMGITFMQSYIPVKSFFDLVKHSVYRVEYYIDSSVKSVIMLVQGKVGKNDVAGPVRVVATIDENVDTAADYGFLPAFLTLLELSLLISASLGVMNLLPIPALDGGRLFFIIIEMILRRPVNRELEAKIHTAGLLLLLLLMLFIIFNDISLLLK